MSLTPRSGAFTPRSAVGTPRGINAFKRTQSTLKSRCFLVAIDGSEQAERGLKLAASCFTLNVDTIKVITVNVGVADTAPGVVHLEVLEHREREAC